MQTGYFPFLLVIDFIPCLFRNRSHFMNNELLKMAPLRHFAFIVCGGLCCPSFGADTWRWGASPTNNKYPMTQLDCMRIKSLKYDISGKL